MSSEGPRRWPRWADPAIAAAALTVGIVQLVPMGAPVVHLLAVAVMCTALAWRRRAPVLAAATVTSAVLVQQVAGLDIDHFATPIALFLAYYSVGAHRELPVATAALLGGNAVFAVGVLLEGLPLFEVIYPAVVITAFWGAGVGIRTRISAAVAAEGRARAAEARGEQAAAGAVADERARIARELHDVVAHSVTVMVMQAGALRRMLPADADREVGLATTVERTGREALVEMRRMLGVLRDVDHEGTPLTPQPGLGHLDDLVERARAAGVPVTLRIEPPPAALPPGVDLCAYRIVQESLTNVIKHAGPARVQVGVSYPPGSVELEVLDDGVGMPAGAPAGGGHGLLGIRERVAVFGGQVSAGPAHPRGFAVRARLPLEAR